MNKEIRFRVLTTEEILASLETDNTEINIELSEKYNRFRKMALEYEKINKGKDLYTVTADNPEDQDSADMWTKVLNHKLGRKG